MRKEWITPSVLVMSSSAVKTGGTSVARYECYQNVYSTCTLSVTVTNSSFYCPGGTGNVGFLNGPQSFCSLPVSTSVAPTGPGPFCLSIVNVGTCS